MLPFQHKSCSAVAEELLKRKSEPYKFVLTYKFSQDHLELLFNKIRQRGGWNNNPNAHAFKMALRRILIQNSIQPSKIGNCTNFDEALCETEGLVKFGWKKPEQKIVRPDTIGVPYNPHTFMVEALLIQNDMDKPSALKDNVLSLYCWTLGEKPPSCPVSDLSR